MITRQQSINKNKFNYIYKKARNYFFNGFQIKYLPNKQNFSQFAIVISKRIQKLAVKRNWIRRVIKSWIKENLNKISKELYFVIIIKKSFDKSSDLDKIKQVFITNISRVK